MLLYVEELVPKCSMSYSSFFLVDSFKSNKLKESLFWSGLCINTIFTELAFDVGFWVLVNLEVFSQETKLSDLDLLSSSL